MSYYQNGTDIKDFKCSWLVVKALERCNEEQKKILDVSLKNLSPLNIVCNYIARTLQKYCWVCFDPTKAMSAAIFLEGRAT